MVYQQFTEWKYQLMNLVFFLDFTTMYNAAINIPKYLMPRLCLEQWFSKLV